MFGGYGSPPSPDDGCGVATACVVWNFRFSFQTATGDRLSRHARGEHSFCPLKTRGMERREAQMCCLASSLRRKLIASRRSIRGDFGRGERSSGTGQTRHAPRSGWLSPAFILSASSRERQSHVVGPDGDPSLPDDTGANRACRRRILLRFKSALEKRPSRTGHGELKRGPEHGDCYPHHEMLQDLLPPQLLRHSIRRHAAVRADAMARARPRAPVACSSTVG